MDRLALVMVDAGYLWSVMTDWWSGENRQREITWDVDYAGLADYLATSAASSVGGETLRTYWYDAIDPRDPSASVRAHAAGQVNGVVLRSGIMQWHGDGRRHQKAVDTRLVADMIVAAYNKICTDIVVLSGDTDLLPGFEEAQQFGLRVHSWGIADTDGAARSMSVRLSQRADTHDVLPVEKLAELMRRQEEQPHTPSPADLAGAGPRPIRAAIPVLSILSPPTFQDPIYVVNVFQDGRAHHADIARVGRDYATLWWQHTGTNEHRVVDDYCRDHHGLPKSIDIDLLSYADNANIDTWSDPGAKIPLRNACMEEWGKLNDQTSVDAN